MCCDGSQPGSFCRAGKRSGGAPVQASLPIYREQNCKPGSVFDSHLSRRAVAGALQPPPEDGRASLMSSHGVAPDRVYSGEQSPVTGWALTPPFHPYLTPQNQYGFAGARYRAARRYLSVALVLGSPPAGVTRYPCPAEPGLSSDRSFRLRPAAVCLTRTDYFTKAAGDCQGRLPFFRIWRII